MSSRGNDDTFLNSTFVLTLVWCLAGLIFLLAPICFHPRRRAIWIKRIRERRWNVRVPPERNADWYLRALERYEQARAEERNRLQSPYTAEQEEEIRQAFLLEKLASYTKTLQDEDIDGESHSYLTPVTEAATESNIADTEEGDNGEATGARLPEAASSDDEQPSAESAVVRSDLEMGNVENDVQVDDSDHFEDDTPVGEFQGTGNSFITVPVAGQTWPLLATEANHAIGVGKLRRVTNGCAVCLCEYEKGDRVTWASNSDCTHVFHEECILNWLLASGRKKQRRRHNNPRESTGDPIRDVTTFPMICPCCRQQYVSIPEGEPEPAVGTNNLSSRAEEGESTASAMELGAVDEGNEAQA